MPRPRPFIEMSGRRTAREWNPCLRRIGAVVAVVALVASASCRPEASRRRVPAVWVVRAGWVLAIAQTDPRLATSLIANPSIVLGSLPAGNLSHGRPSVYAWSWESAAAFEDEVRQRGEWRDSDSRKWIRALGVAGYDPERWPPTPVPEQRDPVAAVERFASLAHSLGVRVLATPGLNLVSVPNASCGRRSDETETGAFLRCDIVGRIAFSVDLVEVQAQSLQRHVSAYRAFVEAEAEQAREADPRVEVLAGLTTGRSVTPGQMVAAWRSVRDVVDGYYLSVSGNDRVPTAVAFLRTALAPKTTA